MSLEKKSVVSTDVEQTKTPEVSFEDMRAKLDGKLSAKQLQAVFEESGSVVQEVAKRLLRATFPGIPDKLLFTEFAEHMQEAMQMALTLIQKQRKNTNTALADDPVSAVDVLRAVT